MNKVFLFYLGGFVREHCSSEQIRIEFVPKIKDGDFYSEATVCVHLEDECVFHEWELLAEIRSEGDVVLKEDGFDEETLRTR